jgi:hypothetical protein
VTSQRLIALILGKSAEGGRFLGLPGYSLQFPHFAIAADDRS